jgi:hypothetical protein
VKPTAHGIDKHVGGSEVRRGLGVTRPPALEPRQRINFFLCAPDLDQRMLGRTPA